MKPQQVQAPKSRKPRKLGLAKQVDSLMAAEEKNQRRFHALEMRDVQKMVGPSPRAPKARVPKGVTLKAKKLSVDELFARAHARSEQASLPVVPPVCFAHGEASIMCKDNASASSDIVISTGNPLVATMHTGDKYVDAMMSGYGDSSSRMPDPYTCVKTFTTNCHYTVTLTPHYPTTGTTTFGGFAMVLMGSGVNTYASSNYNVATLPGDVAITWDSLTGGNTGINTSNFVSRPIGINHTFTYNSVGPAHPVTLTAFPILPDTITALSASPTAWPASYASGLTTVQSIWGGRQWQLNPGESATLIHAPLDNRSWDFEQSNVMRGRFDAYGQMAWNGWVVWAWGTTTGDTFTFRSVVGEECAYINNGSTIYSFPQSRNPADPVRAAMAKDKFSALMEAGYGAFKYATNTVFPMFSKVWSAVSPFIRSAAGMTSDTNPTGYLAGAPLIRAPNRSFKMIKDKNLEVKAEDDLPLMHLSEATKTVNALTDAPEMVTPKNARRPSLTLSLTSRKK